MPKMIIANWKEHPSTQEEAVALAKASDAPGVVVCPPHLFLPVVAKTLKKAVLGAQDGFYEPAGSFTGFVSMDQLVKAGAQYVIVGHSERRALGEDDTIIARKLVAALDAGMTPILCVGETSQEHLAGKTKEVVDRQVRSAFALLPAGAMGQSQYEIFIAYEPTWAISTSKEVGGGTAETPEAAQDVVRYLEGILRGMPVRATFLYGGSVSGETIGTFLSCPEFAGVLVGGASLKPAELKEMIAVAAGA